MRWTAWSVMPPFSWWPRIGIPLICEMSAALPVEWFDTLPDEVVDAVAALQAT